MSFQVETAHVQQYKSNIETLLQQQGSRFREFVNLMTDVLGEAVYFDQIGSVSPVTPSSRHADSPLISTPHFRRRVTPIDQEWGDMVDKNDLVRMLTDPMSAYVQNAAFAMGRGIDDEIITRYYGTNFTGKAGATSTIFTAANEVAVNYHETTPAVSGMIVGKLRRVKELMDANEVEDGDRHIFMAARQFHDLLTSTEVTSSDFNTVRALVNGEINTFLGFQFHRSQRLPVAAGTNDRRCPVYQRNGVGLAEWAAPTVMVGPRPDKRFQPYAYFSMTVGATRTDEDKCYSILADET